MGNVEIAAHLDGERSWLMSTLGEAWSKLSREDVRARNAKPAVTRHLLAVLVEAAEATAGELRRGVPAPNLVNAMALTSVTAVLRRWVNEPEVKKLLPSLAEKKDFRHNLVTWGFADFLRAAGVEVRFPRSGPTKTFDLEFRERTGPWIQVETKAPEAFEGPQADPGSDQCLRAVEKAYDQAWDGQLSDLFPSLVLTGGVALKMRAVARALHSAERFLHDKSLARPGKHPNFLGIVVMCYWSMAVIVDSQVVGNTKRQRLDWRERTYADLAPFPNCEVPWLIRFGPGDEESLMEKVMGYPSHPL